MFRQADEEFVRILNEIRLGTVSASGMRSLKQAMRPFEQRQMVLLEKESERETN